MHAVWDEIVRLDHYERLRAAARYRQARAVCQVGDRRPRAGREGRFAFVSRWWLRPARA